MVTIHSFAEEAAKCRAQADEFAGQPEQPFLLRLSEAFDDLAIQELLSVAASRPRRDKRFTPAAEPIPH